MCSKKAWPAVTGSRWVCESLDATHSKHFQAQPMLQPFQHLRCALRAMRRSCIVRVGALTALALMPVLAQTVPPTTSFPKESTPMSWKTECIGRVLIDMPTDRPRSWSNEFDDAEVRRLQRPLNLSQFWAGVETVRDQYARQSHRMGSSRLGHYERVDARKVAFVMGYRSDASFFGPFMWRFMHMDDQHAYELKQSLSTGNTPPTPALFKPYVDQYSAVLSRIKPLRDGEIPSSEGLCIDGAVVSGDTGRNAKGALMVEIASGTYLGLGYRENLFKVAIGSAFEELKRDQDRADFALTLRNEPLGYKEFKVLRRQEHTLAGLRGQEFITRTTLNNGHLYYSLHWGVKGAEGDLLTPRISIDMSTPDTASNAEGKAYAPLPSEAELIRLWDLALATFRLRPGALPAGQVLRAVN